MDKPILLKCNWCKEERRVFPHFETPKVNTKTFMLTGGRYTIIYKAEVSAKWICPACGNEIHECLEGVISDTELVDFACRGKRGGEDE